MFKRWRQRRQRRRVLRALLILANCELMTISFTVNNRSILITNEEISEN